jgi:hypothetical protein
MGGGGEVVKGGGGEILFNVGYILLSSSALVVAQV